MSLNQTPSGDRVHIGFFGRRNAGKSSVVNAVTGQALSVVSDVKGTTTDPVRKAMELLPLGPVLIIDTPGFDDEGTLGALRIQKTRQILDETDAAVLVAEAPAGLTSADRELLSLLQERGTPTIVAYNKADLLPGASVPPDHGLLVSALTGEGVVQLKERIAALLPDGLSARRLTEDLVGPGDVAVLVTPIDSAAPKGRMILPQQQVIRDVLDAGGINVVTKETELQQSLGTLRGTPAVVITDSQAFAYVSSVVPAAVPLTSFSILFARHHGLLAEALRSAQALDSLPAGAAILIAEGCTHHRQCDDIGTVKLPRWIRQHTGRDFAFHFTSGREFPEDLSRFALVVHCGGCMLNPRAMLARQRQAQAQGIPITNYGVLIAHLQGILSRCVTMFPELSPKEA
ncbi:MAG: [FeFe] hydrogenase H-cluster maturation GTPase HydF [Oscillospiraceae bacterium]|jgi:[FeFe] hydrogenase H-cluster maturation GTPase HydF|nr:[FeFe] hydrogenase H-cluster maturation GTPase HydF [Oscillospiraceae bacterium]